MSLPLISDNAASSSAAPASWPNRASCASRALRTPVTCVQLTTNAMPAANVPQPPSSSTSLRWPGASSSHHASSTRDDATSRHAMVRPRGSGGGGVCDGGQDGERGSITS